MSFTLQPKKPKSVITDILRGNFGAELWGSTTVQAHDIADHASGMNKHKPGCLNLQVTSKCRSIVQYALETLSSSIRNHQTKDLVGCEHERNDRKHVTFTAIICSFPEFVPRGGCWYRSGKLAGG
jgi:hypothetical protein